MSKIASEVNSIYNQVRAIVEEIEQYEKPLWRPIKTLGKKMMEYSKPDGTLISPLCTMHWRRQMEGTTEEYSATDGSWETHEWLRGTEIKLIQYKKKNKESRF